MQPEVRFRQLTADDAPAYKALRLQGIEEHPDAFGSDLAELLERTDDDWRDTLDKRLQFGVFSGEELAATANYDRLPGRKLQHRAMVCGVQVASAHRGKGLGLLLLEEMAAHAFHAGVLQLHLGVGKENGPARRLYERAGYRIVGEDPRALIVDGRPVDEILMIKFLDGHDG